MDNELKINTRVDASGVASGVDQTVAGLQKVKAGADEAAASGKQLGTEVSAGASQSNAALKETGEVAQEAGAQIGDAAKGAADEIAAVPEALKEVGPSATEAAVTVGQASEQINERLGVAADSADAVAEGLRNIGSTGQQTNESYVSGAQESAEVTDDFSAELEGASDQLTDNKEEGEKMINEFGKMKESRRIAIELFETFQGGGETIAGVSGLLRTLVLESELLTPELAAIVGIGLALAAVIGLHEKGKKSTDDLKDSTDALTGAMNATADAVAKTHLEVLNDQLKEYLANQKAIIAQQVDWDANADKRLQYLQRETEATQNLQLTQLEHQKQLALNAAGSDEERAVIEAEYKRKEIALKGGDAQQANLAEQKLLAQQKQENDAERARYLKQNWDNEALVKRYQDDAAQKAAAAAEAGFQPDESGSFEAQIKPQEAKVKAALDDLHKAQDHASYEANVAALADVLSPLGGPAKDLADAQARDAAATVLDKQQALTEESSKLATVREAQQAFEAVKDNLKGWQDAINSNSDHIAKLANALDEIYSKQRVLSTESKTEAIATSTEQLANDESEKKAQGAASKKAQEAQEKSVQDEIENEMGRLREAGLKLNNPGGNAELLRQLKEITDHFEGLHDVASQQAELAQLHNIDVDDLAHFKAETRKQISDLWAKANRHEHP